jgi:hypothetical protein
LSVVLLFTAALNRRTDNTMAKEKGQKEKEKLEGTKQVIGSRK